MPKYQTNTSKLGAAVLIVFINFQEHEFLRDSKVPPFFPLRSSGEKGGNFESRKKIVLLKVCSYIFFPLKYFFVNRKKRPYLYQLYAHILKRHQNSKRSKMCSFSWYKTWPLTIAPWIGTSLPCFYQKQGAWFVSWSKHVLVSMREDMPWKSAKKHSPQQNL